MTKGRTKARKGKGAGGRDRAPVRVRQGKCGRPRGSHDGSWWRMAHEDGEGMDLVLCGLASHSRQRRSAVDEIVETIRTASVGASEELVRDGEATVVPPEALGGAPLPRGGIALVTADQVARWMQRAERMSRTVTPGELALVERYGTGMLDVIDANGGPDALVWAKAMDVDDLAGLVAAVMGSWWLAVPADPSLGMLVIPVDPWPVAS